MDERQSWAQEARYYRYKKEGRETRGRLVKSLCAIVNGSVPAGMGGDDPLDHVEVPLGTFEVEGAFPGWMVEQCAPDEGLIPTSALLP